ncbi:hypothetical protein L1987_21372 [Smallanthus sonchifolius]|uniref:Uncharacterized protein n=1 Tax=Smallanthus sonchifolius TaxID=185202 RepID=A0ACB9IVW8_9ASTR|nr:hypothetical protein L1987_21372 [Smallanthus sonchifolius]
MEAGRKRWSPGTAAGDGDNGGCHGSPLRWHVTGKDGGGLPGVQRNRVKAVRVLVVTVRGRLKGVDRKDVAG